MPTWQPSVTWGAVHFELAAMAVRDREDSSRSLFYAVFRILSRSGRRIPAFYAFGDFFFILPLNLYHFIFSIIFELIFVFWLFFSKAWCIFFRCLATTGFIYYFLMCAQERYRSIMHLSFFCSFSSNKDHNNYLYAHISQANKCDIFLWLDSLLEIISIKGLEVSMELFSIYFHFCIYFLIF